MGKKTKTMFKCRHHCPKCGGKTMNNYKGDQNRHFCLNCRNRFWINCDEKEKEKMKLTKEEKAVIRRLNSLAKVFPKTLWLFAVNGELKVMKYNEDGQRLTTPDGGMSQDGIVASRYIRRRR